MYSTQRFNNAFRTQCPCCYQYQPAFDPYDLSGEYYDLIHGEDISGKYRNLSLYNLTEVYRRVMLGPAAEKIQRKEKKDFKKGIFFRQ